MKNHFHSYRRIRIARIAARCLAGVAPAAFLSLAVAPVPAFAQAERITSKYAGVPIPAGGVPMRDATLTAGMGRFLGEETVKYMKLGPHKGVAEVYSWSGARFKPGRMGFARTALEEALREAGYNYKELGEADNTPNPFQEEWDLGALEISPADGRATYFRATNNATKTTIVGVWLNQESHERFVLGIARAEFSGSDNPAPMTLPDVTGPDTILVKNPKNAMEGVPPPPMPAFPKLTPRPGQATGMVKDGGGRPIAGANIIVQISAAGGFRTSVSGKTKADGTYAIPLPVGVAQVVNADCHVTYRGKDFLLPLHPVDGERDYFPTDKGHVENFVLRTSGGVSKGKSGNYGGTIRLLTWSKVDSEGSIMEVTLTPDGPMLDGSKGRTIVYRFANRNGGEDFLSGIPIGRYTMKTRLYADGDALPMRMRLTFGQDRPLVSSLPVEFESRSQGDIASLDTSGAERFEVTLEP